MTTTDQPTSYNDLKRLAGEALAQAVTEVKNSPTLSARLKEHTEQLNDHAEALKETNRRANWQDQRIADLSDKLRSTQIWLTLSFALTIISSFFR